MGKFMAMFNLFFIFFNSYTFATGMSRWPYLSLALALLFLVLFVWEVRDTWRDMNNR